MILLLIAALAAPDLRLELQRESLSGTHYRYRQYIEGIPVVGGELNVTVRHDGAREEHRRLALPPPEPRIRSAFVGELAWVNVDGAARLTRREVIIEDGWPAIRYLDVESDALVLEKPLALHGKPAAVFDPNPVVKLNAPELRDLNDAAAAVPPPAYDVVELAGLRESGPLGGPWVQITDVQGPAVAPVDVSALLIADRSDPAFEDVNAYFHIDRSQRYLQSLGYVNSRALVPYAVPADTHAAGGRDDSFFIAATTGEGRGTLYFGTGGTDDAEDSDLVVHEYAHAIHEWIAPGTFLQSPGSMARAISEGFGDYWAFSTKYAATLASGRDPFCFADWDARCFGSDGCAYPEGADCLRRTDSAKTIDDYLDGNSSGTEHRNGEIWSSALREIFVALAQRWGLAQGKRMADTLVVESFFGTPPNPSFETMARQMLAAERFVSGAVNRDVICAAMSRRGILEDCTTVPRGEFTMFPGRGNGLVVPDNDPAGLTLSSFINDPRPIEELLVSVDIRHSGRGELRVELIGPDGTTVRLANPSADRSADLITTFGREGVPVDSLDVFRGRSAAGEWRLRVIDVAFGDVATIMSWSVIVRFAGEEPAAARPPISGRRQFIPVAGHSPGANGTFFRTDLQLFNPRSLSTEALLIFTPSAADGRTEFAALRIVLGPEESVTLADVVRTLFAGSGLGQIEIGGDVIASSRTWTPGEEGTFGLYAAAMPPEEALGSGSYDVTHLDSSGSSRANIGFAEVTGAPVMVSVFFLIGDAYLSSAVHVPPFGHVQTGLLPANRVTVSVIGEGTVLAYGAIIDNRSGDPIFVPIRREPHTVGRIPAISSGGAFGTFWRTSIRSRQENTLTYVSTKDSVTRSISSSTPVEDVVASVFERPGTFGALIADTPRPIVARVWTEGANGTYGLYAPFREPSAAPVQHILHVESSEAFRTNFGLLSDVESHVRVTVMDGDGAVVSVFEQGVLPDQVIQFPLRERVVNGRARIDVLSGRVYAYGAVVDNRTGDPILVPAVAP